MPGLGGDEVFWWHVFWEERQVDCAGATGMGRMLGKEEPSVPDVLRERLGVPGTIAIETKAEGKERLNHPPLRESPARRSREGATHVAEGPMALRTGRRGVLGARNHLEALPAREAGMRDEVVGS